MKIILLFFILFSSSMMAQQAKVLVCAPGDLHAARSLDSTLRNFYTDSIDVSDIITGAINRYEAVFVTASNNPPHDSSDEVVLKSFLNDGKKLFLEYSPHAFGLDNFHPDSSSFWHFVGIDFIGIDALNFGVKTVNGIKGTFTEGLSVENKQYSPFDGNFGTWELRGRLQRVLSPLPDPSIDIADLFETDSFKVVLHFPTLQAYREEFLHRVICNYFGLCTPAKVEPIAETKQTTLSIFPNPASGILHVRFDSPNSSAQALEIISEAGSVLSRISCSEFVSTKNQIDLGLAPMKLGPGSYFLRLITEKENIVKPFILLSK